MRKLLLATVAMGALGAGQALAADMVRPAPRIIAAPAPKIFSWSGAYFGIMGGYSWGSVDYLDTISLTGTSFDVKGGILGGVLGTNWQMGSFVLGIEADGGWTNLKGDDGGFGGSIDELSGKWTAAVRGRLGFAFDRALIYATGGVSFLGADYNLNSISESTSKTFVGWTVGAGLDYALTDNVILGVEYRYADYGSQDLTFPTGDPRTVDLTTSSVTGKLVYKFW